MSANTFDSYSVVCPICHRARQMQLGNAINGLYSCPYCQERFVISQSGHFVRDPAPPQPRAYEQTIRRQSRPLARIRRDFGLGKPIAIMILLGSAVFLGYSLTADHRPNQSNPMQQMINWVKKTVKSFEF
jgi:hypothetical protein